MNCHDNNNKNSKGHSPMKHMLHMVLCCGLPILIILALPFIAGISPRAATILGFISPFICPVMMIGMMVMMFSSRNKGHNCCKTENGNQNLENGNTIE